MLYEIIEAEMKRRRGVNGLENKSLCHVSRKRGAGEVSAREAEAAVMTCAASGKMRAKR